LRFKLSTLTTTKKEKDPLKLDMTNLENLKEKNFQDKKFITSNRSECSYIYYKYHKYTRYTDCIASQCISIACLILLKPLILFHGLAFSMLINKLIACLIW
jgi:hypothetical protein